MSKRSSLINPFGFGSSLRHNEKNKDKLEPHDNKNNNKTSPNGMRRESLRVSSKKHLTINLPDVETSTLSLPNLFVSKNNYSNTRLNDVLSECNAPNMSKSSSYASKSLIPDDIRESTPEHVPGKNYTMKTSTPTKNTPKKEEVIQQKQTPQSQLPVKETSPPLPAPVKTSPTPPPLNSKDESIEAPTELGRNASTTSSYYPTRNTRSASVASSYYGPNDHSQVPNRSGSTASSYYPPISGSSGLASIVGTMKSTRTVYENPYSEQGLATGKTDLTSRRRKPPPGMLDNLPPLPPMEISRYKDGNIYLTNPGSPISPHQKTPISPPSNAPSSIVSTPAAVKAKSLSPTPPLHPPLIHPTAKKLPQVPVTATDGLTAKLDSEIANLSQLENETGDANYTTPTASDGHPLSLNKRLSNDNFMNSIIRNNNSIDNQITESSNKPRLERPDIMRRVNRRISQSDTSSSKQSSTPDILGEPINLTKIPSPAKSPNLVDIERIVQDEESPYIGPINLDQINKGSAELDFSPRNSPVITTQSPKRSKYLSSVSPELLPKNTPVLSPKPPGSPKQHITQSPKFTDLHRLTAAGNATPPPPVHAIPTVNVPGSSSSGIVNLNSLDDIIESKSGGINTSSNKRKSLGTSLISHDSLLIKPQFSGGALSNSTASSFDQPFYDVRQGFDEDDEDDWWNPDKDDEVEPPNITALDEEHLVNDTTVIKSNDVTEDPSWAKNDDNDDDDSSGKVIVNDEEFDVNDKLESDSSLWSASKDILLPSAANKRRSLLDDEFGENELTTPEINTDSAFDENEEDDNPFEPDSEEEEQNGDYSRDTQMKELYGDSSEDEDLGIDTSTNDPTLPSFHSDADYYIRSSNTRLSIANPESPGKNTLTDNQSWLETPTSPVKSFRGLEFDNITSPISIHDDRKLVVANKSSSETTSNGEFDDNESKSSGLNFSVHHYNHFDVDDEEDDRPHKMVIVNGVSAPSSKGSVADRSDTDFPSNSNYDSSFTTAQPIPTIITSSPPQQQKGVPTYDRREELTVAPLTHSSVIPTAIAPGSTSLTRRPPPDFPTGGRDSRSVSMTTSQPDMFDILAKAPGATGSSNAAPTVTGLGISSSVPPAQAGDSNMDPSLRLSVPEISNSVMNEDQDVKTHEGKGIKSDYVAKLRTRGKVCVIEEVVPDKLLPISIKTTAKNNKPINSRRHARTQSHQSTHSFSGSLKHGSLKPKTRMLASEIDASELPDSKLSHSLGKTKIPTNPDAEIIAVTDQLRRLTERPTKQSLDDREGGNAGGGLNRYASVRSARGFAGGREGGNFKLFIANPDSDSD